MQTPVDFEETFKLAVESKEKRYEATCTIEVEDIVVKCEMEKDSKIDGVNDISIVSGVYKCLDSSGKIEIIADFKKETDVSSELNQLYSIAKRQGRIINELSGELVELEKSIKNVKAQFEVSYGEYNELNKIYEDRNAKIKEYKLLIDLLYNMQE